MKKIIIILFFVSIGLAILSLTATALEYPFPFLKNKLNPTPCEYVAALYIWGLGIVGAMAVTAIAIGGFLYITGQAQKGKEIILSALLGVLLLMGSWLLLNTINPDLAKLKCDLPQTAPGPGSPPAGPSAPAASPKPDDAPPQTAPASPSSANDQQVRNQLVRGVAVNRACLNENSSTCLINGQKQTCLDGLQPNAISGVNAIKSNCNCSLVITGGTESCHSSGPNSHESGKKLDLAVPNMPLSSYIYSQIGTSNPDPDKNYPGKDGNVYRYETNHWDICFQCRKI